MHGRSRCKYACNNMPPPLPPPPLTCPLQASARGPAPVAIAAATVPSQNKDAVAWQIVSGCMMALLLVSLVVIYRCQLWRERVCAPLTFTAGSIQCCAVEGNNMPQCRCRPRPSTCCQTIELVFIKIKPPEYACVMMVIKNETLCRPPQILFGSS